MSFLSLELLSSFQSERDNVPQRKFNNNNNPL
jgi:hypothetical protein